MITQLRYLPCLFCQDFSGESLIFLQEAKWDVPETLPPAKWPQKGNIVFENFKVRYRSELDLVLKGLNFSVNEREKVRVTLLLDSAFSFKHSLMILQIIFEKFPPSSFNLLLT